MKVTLILFITFLVSFFVATAAFDTVARQAGFYDEGIADSEGLR